MTKNKYIFHLKDGRSITIEDDCTKLNDFINEASVLMGSNRIGKIVSSNSILIIKPMNISCVEICTSNTEELLEPEIINTDIDNTKLEESSIIDQELPEETFEFNSFDDIDVDTIGKEVDKILNNTDSFNYEEIHTSPLAEQQEESIITQEISQAVNNEDPDKNLDIISRVKKGIETASKNSDPFHIDKRKLLPGESVDDFSAADDLDDLEAPVQKPLKKKKKIKI